MIDISLSKAELLFMREAAKEKFNSWMEELGDAQEELEAKEYFDSQYLHTQEPAQPEEVVKKPHWTHTAKGKKILAARKRRTKK